MHIQKIVFMFSHMIYIFAFKNIIIDWTFNINNSNVNWALLGKISRGKDVQEIFVQKPLAFKSRPSFLHISNIIVDFFLALSINAPCLFLLVMYCLINPIRYTMKNLVTFNIILYFYENGIKLFKGNAITAKFRN